MGEGLCYRVRKFSRKHLAVVVGVLAVMLLLGTAMIVNRAAQGMAEEAYGRATQVARGLNRATERRLARAYQELAEVYGSMGASEKAEEFAVRAAMAFRQAETSVEPETP